MNNNFLGEGINSLIPQKQKSPLPQSEEKNFLEKEDEALANRISQKLESTLSPLYQVDSDLMIKSESGAKIEKIADLDEPPQCEEPKIGVNKKSEKIFYLETNKIRPNPLQPRRYFSEESIEELAESIREFGVLEPIIVYRREEEKEAGTEVYYELISGERRLLAAKKLGLETIPAIIRQEPAEKEKLEMALIENLQREDLTPINKARAYRRLMEEFGLTQEEVAQKVSKSREVVANTLRLLQLPIEAQKALEQGKINEAQARAILMLSNPQKRLALLAEILRRNLSGREAEELAKRQLGYQPAKMRKTYASEPEDLSLKEKLESFFNTPVIIKKGKNGGEISIKFYSEEELSKIINLILGKDS